MKLKKILAFIIILSTICFTGCWNGREINTLSIVICTGIDKTENGYLVTQQVLNPKAIVTKKATNEAPVIIYTGEGKNLFEIYRRITTECPRKIYNSHLRMVIFGDNISKEGIKDVLDLFARDHEFRTDFSFVVAKDTTANEVLSILTPLDAIPGIEMYNSLRTSEAVWAPTKSIRIVELVNSIVADGKSPVLTGVEITPGTINSNSTDALKETDEIKRLKYTSLGAFKKDKLVGWLNEDEAKGYNYIIGEVKSTTGYADYGEDIKITFEVTNAKSTMKASLINGKPAIEVEINIKQNIGAIEGAFDVSKEENEKIINEISEEKIKSICEKAVNKAQKELKTDIFGFGEVIHRKYPKLWANIKDDWNNGFNDLPVNISVKIKTNKMGQISKSFFIKEKE